MAGRYIERGASGTWKPKQCDSVTLLEGSHCLRSTTIFEPLVEDVFVCLDLLQEGCME